MKKIMYLIIYLLMTDSFSGTASAQKQNHNYEYAAKIVCGTQGGQKFRVHSKGKYFTSINIHNPNMANIKLFKKLALTQPPGGQEGGKIFEIGYDILGSDVALATNCSDIQRRLFPSGFPGGYIEGFVIIQSPKSLDVSAVYTSEIPGWWFFPSEVSSIDVEQIKERLVEGRTLSELPDYIPVPNYQGSYCDDENQSDSLAVAVKNIGIGDGLFDSKIKVIFDGGSAPQTLIVPPLASGEIYDLIFSPPRNCFQGPAFPPVCKFEIRVDDGGDISESDEMNNNVFSSCVD